MAGYKDPPKHTQIKKGEVRNPGGRPKLPEDLKRANRLTNEQFIRIANKYLNMDRAEMKVALADPKASMLELMVGGMIAKAAKDQDWQRANFILDRTIGKVKEPTLDVNFNFNNMPRQEVIDLGRQAINFLSLAAGKPDDERDADSIITP